MNYYDLTMGKPDLEYYLEMTGKEFDLWEILLPRLQRRCQWRGTLPWHRRRAWIYNDLS